MSKHPVRREFRVSSGVRVGLIVAAFLALIVMIPGFFEGNSSRVAGARAEEPPRPMPGGDPETAVLALG